MRQDFDYHVGVMRGYLLALNAPTQVLHALDVLLAGYTSRAGDVIGNHAPPALPPAVKVTPQEIKALLQPEKPIEEAPSEGTFLPKKSHFWTTTEIRRLKELYPVKSGAEIAEILNKPKSSVYYKASELGLKKDRKVA